MLKPDEIKAMPKLKIYMQYEHTFKWLKDKLVRILNRLNPTYELSEKKIRLWKSNMSYTKPE
jgi:hypothetical protein